MAGDLGRIVRLLHQEHGFSVEQCHKVIGALRAYEYPLIRMIRAEMLATVLFEQVVERCSLAAHLPSTPIARAWMERIRNRGLLEAYLQERERDGQEPLEVLLKLPKGVASDDETE